MHTLGMGDGHEIDALQEGFTMYNNLVGILCDCCVLEGAIERIHMQGDNGMVSDILNLEMVRNRVWENNKLRKIAFGCSGIVEFETSCICGMHAGDLVEILKNTW